MDLNRYIARKADAIRIEKQKADGKVVDCPDCGRTVSTSGLKQHQQTKRCIDNIIVQCNRCDANVATQGLRGHQASKRCASRIVRAKHSKACLVGVM